MPTKKNAKIIDFDDLRLFLKIFSKNWYIIASLALVSFVFSYFYTYKLTDIYSVKSQILLKSDDTYDYQNQLYSGLGFYQSYLDNSNQIRVITSNDIIEKVLSKLKVDISYFIEGRFKTTEVYEYIPFDISIRLLNESLYEKDIKFKILDEKHFQISYDKGEEKVVKKYAFDEKIEDTDFFMTVTKNGMVNNLTIANLSENNYLIKVHNLNNLIYKIKNNLRVENIENTTILELSLEDEIPARAVTFLDTLSKEYIEYTSEAQLKINQNTIENIDKQLKEIVNILASIEDDLENYKSNKAILDLTREQDEYFRKLIEYDKEKRDVELRIQSLDALEKYILTVAGKADQKLLPPSFYIEKDDGYLQTALSKLYSMQMSRNEILFGATESNRGIKELDQNIELLRKNILTYIDNSRSGLLDKIKDIQLQIGDYTDIIRKIPKTQRDLLTIQRKVDVNEKMYEFLLEKRSTTIIARAGILPETRVIEKAHSVGIVKPNKGQILNYFLIAGIILGLIITFIRSVFFAKIENIFELKRLTRLPIMGEIVLSQSEKGNYLAVDKDPNAPVTQSFRTIRTNLEYMASDVGGSKTILITSLIPGEGKTFCSVNLAIILSKAGKRVLLIELDLHKPKIQKALNMSSDIGVSNILIGKTGVAEAILPTGMENLFVILSGPTPPNASEIILSDHLKEMLAYGKANFDYVIVDTAPIGLITDALVIAKHVDISLFILNTRYAKKQSIDMLEEIVENNKFHNFCLVLNGVKHRRSRYGYGYGYGYGFSYGYGYGYGYGGYGKKN
jgi:tyrosine-protein kinase Etk/Wzc